MGQAVGVAAGMETEKSAAAPTYLKKQGKNISLLILFNNSWQSKMPGKK